MIKLIDILNEVERSPLDRLKSELETMAHSWDKSGRKGVAKQILAKIVEMSDIADAVAYLETLKYTAKEAAKGYYVASLLKRYAPQPLAEAKKEEPKIEAFEDFAETRGKGAAKIASNAEEKGGLALLTWHHFKVKAPYYKKATEGKFNKEQAEKEYKELLEKLYKATSKQMDITQTGFQELVGKIEALGELIIKHK